jgi:hypothetical protein
LSESLIIIKRTTEALLEVSKEVQVHNRRENEVKATFMCHQNTRQFYNTIPNTFFKYVKKFKYLKIAVTIQNWIHKEVQMRLNPRKFFYHSV